MAALVLFRQRLDLSVYFRWELPLLHRHLPHLPQLVQRLREVLLIQEMVCHPNQLPHKRHDSRDPIVLIRLCLRADHRDLF
eukprot:CAMPEP_0180401706 /NCGR_PEP_ID=MMETSP0989-20121125/38443_1 /TAXON_ID=697907 /ORGANISM="non described non described, Strain CCMP2293" /LENGTH=80 /DNA_ID=CAMNT_0022404709 /DNA_START=39 /DNA_END=278 /DNA_ORIENTATION=-